MSLSPRRNPPLVLGAGPSGLAVANETADYGVPCRVVDKRAGREGSGGAKSSRSFTVHSETLLGLRRRRREEPFVAEGVRYNGMVHHLEDGRHERLNFGELEGPFPFILGLEQNVTEQIMRDQFCERGGQIEWNTTLRALRIGDDGLVTATLEHTSSSGLLSTEYYTTPYLIACDGRRSTVRELLGIGTTGGQYTGQLFWMGDYRMPGNYRSPDEIHYDIKRNRMLLTALLPSEYYRVLVEEKSDQPRTVTASDPDAMRAYLQRIVDEHIPGARLAECSGNTEFEVFKSLADTYRCGPVFFVGDAGHNRSIAGGQGMNACIQDGWALGRVLSEYLRGRAPESILDSYEAERRPIGAQVIDGTDMLHKVIMGVDDDWEKRQQTYHGGWHRKTVKRISGTDHTYREVTPQGLETAEGLRSGDRAPELPITANTSVHNLLTHLEHTLLVFHRREDSTMAADVTSATEPFRHHLRVHVIATPELRDVAPVGALIAEDTRVHDRYGVPDRDSVAWIRPDGFIGYLTDDVDALLTRLKAVLLP